MRRTMLLVALVGTMVLLYAGMVLAQESSSFFRRRSRLMLRSLGPL